MIERQTIEDFIKLMVEHDLVELDLTDGDQSITLRRAEPNAQLAYLPPQSMPAPAPPSGTNPAASAAAPMEHGGSGDATASASAGGVTIDSPMVGTFYSKPNPDSEPFVGPGVPVQDSTVVCLIEAMKVFNEIKAECSGKIAEVLVKDGDPVEYGQPLFRIATA